MGKGSHSLPCLSYCGALLKGKKEIEKGMNSVMRLLNFPKPERKTLKGRI